MNVLQHILEVTNAIPGRTGWKGNCPSHNDVSPSLSIDGRDGKILLKCWAGCDTRDVVKAMGLTMDDLTVGEDGLIHDVWSEVIVATSISDIHYKHLQTRVKDNVDFGLTQYRSVGQQTGKELKAKLFSVFTIDQLKQVPGVFDTNGMLLRLPEGILIPIRDRWGKITGVQIRRDDGKPKYWTPKGTKLGVHVPLTVGTLNVVNAIRVTEGPLKADVATLLSGTTTLGLVGSNNWSQLLPLLHQLGATDVVVSFDADYQTNEGVRASLVKLVKTLQSEAFRVGIETWDGTKAKGIDDALVKELPILITYDIDSFLSNLSSLPSHSSDSKSNSAVLGVDRSSVEVVKASSVGIKRTDWVWKNWLPVGSVTIMDGDPSLGKSQITLSLAAAVTASQSLPDGQLGGEPAAVIIMSAEDSLEATSVPRLIAAGADLNLVNFFKYVKRGEEKILPSLPQDIKALEEMIKDNGAKLVVIDPFFAYLDKSVNSFKDHEVRQVMDRLGRMADRQGCSILLLRHLNKMGSANAMYRGGGSIGIIAAARSGWLVAKDPYLPPLEPGGILTVTKNNLGPYPNSLRYSIEQVEVGNGIKTSRIVWNGTSDLVAGDVVSVNSVDRSESDKRMSWLADLIHDKKEITANQLRMACEKTGYSFMKLLKLSPNLLANYGIMKGGDNVWRASQVEAEVHSTTVSEEGS